MTFSRRYDKEDVEQHTATEARLGDNLANDDKLRGTLPKLKSELDTRPKGTLFQEILNTATEILADFSPVRLATGLVREIGNAGKKLVIACGEAVANYQRAKGGREIDKALADRIRKGVDVGEEVTKQLSVTKIEGNVEAKSPKLVSAEKALEILGIELVPTIDSDDRLNVYYKNHGKVELTAEQRKELGLEEKRSDGDSTTD